nr:chorismate-binding protein [Pseudomonadota bacterium]
HLIHTVDHLEGYLEDNYDALDAFQTHMWACTVTGAPKPAALQEIENLEKSPRAWYSGAIGMLCFNGSLNTGITLRTAWLKEGRAYLRAGATLLYGSDPALEEQETRTKAAALLSALASGNSKKAIEKETPARIKLKAKRKILLVDYRDSFVHNLAAYLRELDAEVITLRCGFESKLLQEIKPNLVFLSPGPGTPEEFGVPNFVGELVKLNFPVFGVCLGHQGIGQHFGGSIAQLPIPEHGKVSLIKHNNNFMFASVDQTFEAGRYHSLYIRHQTVPSTLEITAETIRTDENGKSEIIPMAFRHKSLPIASVQFHPESLMTLKKNAGHYILKNAIDELTK